MLSRDQPAQWQPTYLRRIVLCLFIAAFCGIIIALEVLSHVSQSRSGLASSEESRHYSWTYAPAAIIIFITALWTRVEFQAKQSAPWRSMNDEAENANRSVLLDYISDMQPVAIWKALKNKDLIVTAGISCTLLLRLAIIFSTSLFTLKETNVVRNNVSIQLNDYFTADDATFNGPGMQPYVLLNAILFENASYPEGTSPTAAFQTFSAPNLPADSNLTVPVEGMQTDLDCEEADLLIKTWKRVTSEFANFNSFKDVQERAVNEISSPSCTISNFSLGEAAVIGQPYMNLPYYAEFVNTTCDNSNESVYLAYLVEFHGKTPVNKDGSQDMVLDRSTQLICRGNYSRISLLAHGGATTDANSTVKTERVGSNSSTFPNISTTDISRWINKYRTQTLQSQFGSQVTDSSAFHASDGRYGNSIYLNDALEIGALIAGVTGDIQQLFEPAMLQEIATSYYKAEGAQLLHGGLAKKHSSLTSGSAIVRENRVVMTSLSLRVIEVCLALVILQVIAILVLDPARALPPDDPNRVSSIGAILHSSPFLQRILRGTGGMSLETLEKYLATSKFVAQRTENGIFIEVTNDDHEDLVPHDDNTDESRNNCQSWTPFPSRIFRIIGSVLVLLIIVALEVILHFSEINDGLGDVSNVTYKHYLWTTIPAIVMVLIGLFYGSLSSNIRTIAPYAQLRQSTGVKFEQSLGMNFLDALDITNVFRSIQAKQFAVLATTLAVLGTSFLNIVTSGLFSTVEVPRTVQLNLTQDTVFSTTGLFAGDSSYRTIGNEKGQVIADQILLDNLTYPQWTYDGFVFPTLSIESNSNWTEEGVYMEARVPALRISHSCETKTGVKLNITKHDDGYSFTLNWPAFTRDPFGPNKTITLEADNLVEVLSTQQKYFGFAHSASTATDAEGLTGNASVTIFAWGYFGNGTPDHITAMTCTNVPEIVQTDVRFELPGFNITDVHPPIPDESTAHRRLDIPLSSAPWTTQDDVNTLNGIVPLPEYYDLDGFFTALVLGRYGIPLETLGNASEDAATISAIKRQLSIVQSQEFNNYTRVDANGTLDDFPLFGNVTLPTRLRVVQSMASTRVLDVLLACIVILGIFGSFAMNTDHVLPKSPTSIAAVGSLLADSNFLQQYGSLLGEYSDKALGRDILSHSRLFLVDGENVHLQGKETMKSAMVGKGENLTIYVSEFTSMENLNQPEEHDQENKGLHGGSQEEGIQEDRVSEEDVREQVKDAAQTGEGRDIL